MDEYRVTWEIDVSAESPHHAAKIAREIQLKSDSTATVFLVKKTKALMPGTVVVDLMNGTTRPEGG